MAWFKDTVESIVSDITSKIERLHVVAEAKAVEADTRCCMN